MARLRPSSAALLLLCALCALCSLAAAAASLVNVDVARVVDVGSTLAISRATVTMRNDGDSDAATFFLAVHKSDVPGLGDFWVTMSDDKDRRALPMAPASPSSSSAAIAALPSCCRGFEVTLPQPLAPGATTKVDVRMDVGKVIAPVPAQIARFDTQYMVFSGNAHFYSPYKTEKSETNVLLGSTEVTSQEAPAPAQRTAKRLRLGPYTGVDALSHGAVRVRFRNDRGLLVAARAAKRVHVSHWGGLAVAETYDVRNAAAQHVGEWSRVDHGALGGSRYATAVEDVWANLPADATRVEYRDLVGNITTSRLRRPTRARRAVQLRFRFPLMGGWRNHFWVRYDLALRAHAQSAGLQHRLSVPLMPSLNADVPCEQLELAVALPEWAGDVAVDPHPSLGDRLEVRHERVRASMTLFGRPVVRMAARDLRSQSKHANRVVVRYSYNTALLWVTPLIAVGWILGLFVVGIVCARLGAATGGDDGDDDDAKRKRKSE